MSSTVLARNNVIELGRGTQPMLFANAGRCVLVDDVDEHDERARAGGGSRE